MCCISIIIQSRSETHVSLCLASTIKAAPNVSPHYGHASVQLKKCPQQQYSLYTLLDKLSLWVQVSTSKHTRRKWCGLFILGVIHSGQRSLTEDAMLQFANQSLKESMIVFIVKWIRGNSIKPMNHIKLRSLEKKHKINTNHKCRVLIFKPVSQRHQRVSRSELKKDTVHFLSFQISK